MKYLNLDRHGPRTPTRTDKANYWVIRLVRRDFSIGFVRRSIVA